MNINNSEDGFGRKLSREEIAAIDPELLEVMDEVDQDLTRGEFRFPPRTIRECRDWWDGWLHVISRAGLSQGDYLWQSDGKVRTVVLYGRSFGGNLIPLLEKLSKGIGPDMDLAELRLVDTALNSELIERISPIVPTAKVKVYSKLDHEANRRLGYADPKKAEQMIPHQGNSADG